jgi:hypothetical protein
MTVWRSRLFRPHTFQIKMVSLSMKKHFGDQAEERRPLRL